MNGTKKLLKYALLIAKERLIDFHKKQVLTHLESPLHPLYKREDLELLDLKEK
jgi:hypothetical protein